MRKDKVFVFAPYSYGINNGGPSGFIAHNLVDKPRDNFILSGDILDFDKKSFSKKLKNSIGKRICKLLNKRWPDIIKQQYFKKIKANNYKFIFFHEVFSLYQCRNLISKDQVVILQSHSPELPSEEFLMPNKQVKSIDEYEFAKEAEKYGFSRANIILFPTPGTIPIYKNLISPKSEIRFILSGAKSKDAYVSNTHQYDQIIDKDKINLMYIGRRNEVKGFDIVLNSFRKIRETRKDLNLIIVGKGEKIIEEGIIDIGFSPDPISWYNSVDYLINANRQSYFDLSIIEALSTGVPIIMSNNFGHHFYDNISPLIKTFDSQDQEALYKILAGELKKRNYEEKHNINIYKNQLTDQHYFGRFNDFCLSLIEK